MASRRENIQNTLKSNGRARTTLVIVGVVVLAMLVFGFMSITSDDTPTINEQSSVPPPPEIENIPGSSTDEAYNELTQEANRRRAEAANPGDTTLPILEASPDSAARTPWDSTLPSVPGQEPVEEPAPEPVVQTEPEPVQVPPEPVYQAPVQPEPVVQSPAPAYDAAALERRYQNTSQQLNNYLVAWSQVPAGSQEFEFNGQKPEQASQVQAGMVQAGMVQAGMPAPGMVPGAAAQASSGSADQGPSLVRSGTVVPAVLLSTINSDNPGPVLAQITTGPLSGTRLLGSFKSTGKAVVLTFNSMSNPRLGTFSIEALAVDEKYSVGMATDVDNHYFRRYGLLLAGALLEGYGEAMGRSNTVVVTGPFGTTTTQGELDSKQINAVAAGRVGQVVSQELLEQSQVDPTVHLDCGGGCPVGILFMSDL